MDTAEVLLIALALDAALGEPPALWSRLPHPAVVMGRVVDWADRQFNRGAERRLRGLAVTAGGVALAVWLGGMLAGLPGGAAIEVVLAAVLLAQRSLVEHVADVAGALRRSLPEGRAAVARIVGRDTDAMDAPAVARAAIESAAENFSDGVVAPAFWFLLLGLPGLLVYKLVNTADSMIGYRTPRHEDFGRAAARLDDLLNWIPARLTAALIAALHGRLPEWQAIGADAAMHRSPNAGWPEAAMARALRVALAGPRSYDGQMRDYAFVNSAGDRAPGPEAIEAAVAALWRAWAAGLAAVALIAVL